MHIAVVTRNLSAGGAERVIAQLISKWNDWGVTCSLVSMYPTQSFYCVPEAVQAYDIDGQSRIPGFSKLLKYGQLRKALKQLRPDVILAMPEDVGVYTILAMLGTGIPVVVSERNNPWVMPNKKITRLLRRVAYPFAAGLFFQTTQAMSFFPRYLRNKGIVLDNPLDLTRLPEPVSGDRNKRIISAGRLDDQKNFSLLLTAFAIFYQKHPQYQLVIYGEGKKRAELEALAKKLLPDEAWSMPGRVTDLPQKMAQCEMFVLSSDFEGVPNVLIEAMACGLPVVSTDCAPGGAAHLIDPGKNGLLVPVGNAAALAEGMMFLAEHSQEAAQMGRNATDIRQRMDANHVAAQWLKYLQEIGCKE